MLGTLDFTSSDHWAPSNFFLEHRLALIAYSSFPYPKKTAFPTFFSLMSGCKESLFYGLPFGQAVASMY